MDLIEGIKTVPWKADILRLSTELWEMDLIEGIKTKVELVPWFPVRQSYEKWTW